MATNRRKDAATLYEVLGRAAQKTPKKESPAATPKAAEVESTPSMNNRTPLRTPVAGSIRPPPSRASLYPAAVAAPKKEAQNSASGAQVSPEPVLLDQILARFRPWILVVAAGIVALILAVVIIVSTSGHSHRKPLEPIAISPGTPTPGLVQPQLLPVNGNSGAPSTPSTPAPVPQPPRVQVGRVVPAGDVNRSANRWYLVILTTLPQYAQHAAAFIAKHGVSVTVENGPQNFKCVISVRGFKHRAGAAAIALRRKVVYIGTLLPDARRAGRSDFNTAYYAHVQRSQ
ncbi:MAG: hypothetical protein ACYCZQ_15710 [Burkholderiales bacterium]|jgi:hypothetical protein